METSDLYIRADKDLSVRAKTMVRSLREDIRGQIERQSEFFASFTPVKRLPGCPSIIAMMYDASEKAGVGPMAAVAGAISDTVGRDLADLSEELIVENGGDIWMNITRPAVATIYPGGYYFNGVALRIYPGPTPCGICTSSARIGLSLSFGKADAATVIAHDAALADAIATEVCNRVAGVDDLEDAASYGIRCGAAGVVIIYRDRLVAQGDIELTDPYGELL